MPSLTVVIPVYNRASLVGRTLASIERQSTRDFAVVLVDNNSTDDTRRVLNAWRDRMVATGLDVMVILNTRPGSTATRNAGLALVSTPYTMFFDSDDEMLPTHIADFLQTAREHPEAELIGRPAIQQNPDGHRRPLRFTTSSMLYNHIFHAILSTQRYMARTELFRRVGAWNEELKEWDDLELGVRLLVAKPVAAIVPGQPTVIQHQHEASITGIDYFHNHAGFMKTLDCCTAILQRAGYTNAVHWIDVRRVILAAEYTFEGHPAEGRHLLGQTLARSSRPGALRAIYHYHCVARRGTALAARLFFP